MIRFVSSKVAQSQDNGFQRLFLISTTITDTQVSQFYHCFTGFAIYYHFIIFIVSSYFSQKSKQYFPKFTYSDLVIATC